MLASVLFVSMLLTTCSSDVDNTGGKPDKQGNSEDIYALDISKRNTGWDYLVFNKTGSSIVFKTDKSTGKPSRLYLRPKKDSDDGYTILFKENGLPDKVIRNGFIMCFDNFKDYKFDLAIIYPDKRIEYHYGIQTDIDFNKRTVSTQGRSVFSDITDALSYVSLAIDISTCILATVAPPLLLECVPFLVVELGHLAADHFLDGVNQDIANTLLDALDCASNMNIDGALDVIGFADACISAFTGLVDLLIGMDNDLLVYGMFEEVEEASAIIAGDYRDFDIKVVLTFERIKGDPWGLADNYMDLRVIINGEELDAGIDKSPVVIKIPKGKAPAGHYIVAAEQWSTGISDCEVRIFAFGKSKTYKARLEHRAGIAIPAKFVYVASFDSDGHIWSDSTAPKVVAVTGVTLDRTALTLSAGDTATLTAAIAPTDATNKYVTWSSNNNRAVTVNNGNVTAVAAGSAIITVTTADGRQTATCAVTVTGGGVGPSPSTDYTGTYTGGLITSDYSQWAESVTLTTSSISGGTISISNVRIGPNNVISTGGTNGTWAYVYSGSAKIGIVCIVSDNGDTIGLLIIGKSQVEEDEMKSALSEFGIAPLISDMGDYYQGVLEKN